MARKTTRDNVALREDPEYQRFWAAFRNIEAYLHRGLYAHARRQIVALSNDPRRPTYDPQRRLDYSHAVALQQAAFDADDVRASALILQSILRDSNRGVIAGEKVLIRTELSAAMNLLGRFEQARQYAQQAIDSAGKHKGHSLAFQNLGRAQFELGRLAEARTSHVAMMDLALKSHRVSQAGIAAEWLSRVALREGNPPAAATWCDLATDAYRTSAPQHLRSLSSLKEEIGSNAARAPVTDLGAQAVALRNEVLPQNELGDYAGIHLDSLHVDLGALRVMADLPESASCELIIPFLPEKSASHVRALETRHQFAGLILSEMQELIPHEWDRKVLDAVLQELWPEHRELIVRRLFEQHPQSWDLRGGTDPGQPWALVWSTQGAGPAAFGTELSALALLLQGGLESRQKALAAMPQGGDAAEMQFLNLADRAFPRPIQLWMIVNGQSAAGGPSELAHLAEDTTRGRAAESQANRLAFQKMGYTPDEIASLQRGSLIALHVTELMLEDVPPPRSIGTTPINEINGANPPARLPPTYSIDRPGFAIDREYNSVFFAPSPADPSYGWYGCDNSLFRDHFTEFRKQITITGAVRAKHYAIPVVDVETPSALFRLHGLLKEAAERLKPSGHVAPDAEVWYRGQTCGYFLDRPETVQRYLFGTTGVEEPSLPGAAPRRGWNYLKVHSFLSTMLQARIYREATNRGESFEQTYENWRRFALGPADWDLGVMLLAQHYGIPTHGIDITNDLDVALWFATNKFSGNPASATYLPVQPNDWGATLRDSPLIYAILPVTHSLKGAIREVDLLMPFGIEALRPKRQSAAFFMGAHGLHKNRLAEALVCVMRLAPGNWPTRCSYPTLFPAAQEDPSYAWMLDLKAHYRDGDIGKFLNEIPHYRP